MPRLIECVPNFSEGRDQGVIDQITAAIESVTGATLLDVDPGRATHRTVVTFVGEPEPVIEAAVQAALKAGELIDMAQHSGEHPRFGALDVCPLVPISGVSMEECAEYARTLARRLGEEAGLTVYCYENAALRPARQDLAAVRAGEYEGLEARLADPEWAPDFGPAVFQSRTGATAVGARDFLVAYNVNLNTTSARRANAVAFDVREKGRVLRAPDPLTGEIVHDEAGQPVWKPGSLKCVKGIGWYIEEYGVAQISMNLTNISVTPTHVAFDECCERARDRGLRVTGSEIVGLVPLEAMLSAGRHYLRRQQRSLGVPDDELIRVAVLSMGLNDLTPFVPEEKIIERIIEAKAAVGGRLRLVDRTLSGFTQETASESPAPGGGSVAAAVGALGAALGTMVANLSAHKRGWDERWEEFSKWAERGQQHFSELLELVDRDTQAFEAVMAAWRADPSEREQAVQHATRGAIAVPLRVMEVSVASFEVLEAMAKSGLPASLSDAGVGALCARTAVLSAELNVRINAPGITDEDERAALLGQAAELRETALRREREVLALVDEKLD
ncbi:MAG: glutamate formimidoyltransferase [Planctomycetota bacterium]